MQVCFFKMKTLVANRVKVPISKIEQKPVYNTIAGQIKYL